MLCKTYAQRVIYHISHHNSSAPIAAHMSVNRLSIDSDNGFSAIRSQAII